MDLGSEQTTIVVPCFNEEQRLDEIKLKELVDHPDVALLLVDDGSTDATAVLLDRFAAAHPHRVQVMHLTKNVGKAEAVRLGLRAARESGAPIIGYLDADFATPPHEFLRLLDLLRAEPEVQVLLGARVALLGRRIVRSRVRHYLGRVFATISSFVLDLRVYDTQCGAKLFRSSPALDESLADPFHSRWAFDVELLARLARALRTSERGLTERSFVEVPLREWQDVGGSKLGPAMAGRAFVDLMYLGILARVPRRRRRR